MLLNKNAFILSGAFATLLSGAIIPVQPPADAHSGMWAKYLSIAALADENESSSDDSSDDSGDDSSDDSGGDDSSGDGGSSDDSNDDSNDDANDDNGGSGGSDDSNDDGGTTSAQRSTGGSGFLNSLFGGDRSNTTQSTSDTPRVQLQVHGANRQGLLDGSLKAVDNLGRVLEIEVETEHGTSKIIATPHGDDASRTPGEIKSVKLVPAS